jgi:hypothetical protein
MWSTAEERKKKRRDKRRKDEAAADESAVTNGELTHHADDRVTEWLTSNEDELLKFTAKVNKLYHEKLHKDAPFMTFVFCGMQSAGKSTVMERFLCAVLNIVQEGTGTRCPLDTTCIHDNSCTEPKCDLYGEELESCGDDLTVNEVFERITKHNVDLGNADRFSTQPLRLVYRASNVQNMRFVDTPGVITSKSTGKDNREDIKAILSSEILKANTKLCVLLEPKEFETNYIVEFCDESLGGRDKWIHKAIFIMNKFDKQLEDSRSASKANGFFREFHKNGCFPHLIMTPTLAKENLPHAELFNERRKLLASADSAEKKRFDGWLQEHENFRQDGGDNELLNAKVADRIGFATCKRVMREILLSDTAKRLPEVLRELRAELDTCRKEAKTVTEKLKFTDPSELRVVVHKMVFRLQQRVLEYLNGDLESALKFPEWLMTLDDELDAEDDSDWAEKELNFYSEAENQWRERIVALEVYPPQVQAEKKFLGGKQCQRAIAFFRAVMIEALPDPFELEDKVANATGYLGGGLQRENWEGAMVQVTKTCMKDITHPGINFLVKHVGSILRRLFSLALEDIKRGEEMSTTFKMMPNSVETYLKAEFDNMLWSLMTTAADKTHCHGTNVLDYQPKYSDFRGQHHNGATDRR